MKEWMEPIDSELPLAKAFNRIISDLELLRIMTNPRIFSDSTDKEAPFLRPATFADNELIKVSEMVKAMDNGQLVYTIAQIIESLTSEIESITKSDKAFSDNHDLLNAILHDTTSILNLHLDETRFFQSSKPSKHLGKVEQSLF